MTVIWLIVPDMRHGRQNFLSFWIIFCPLTPLTTQKIQILKKNEEKSLCYNVLIMCYTVLEIWCVADVICIFFYFRLFFPFLPPSQKKKRKFKKNEKKSWRYHHFTVCTKKYDHIMYSSWDMLHDRWVQRWYNRWTDGEMDRWMKKSRTCEEGGAHVRIAFWC